LERRQGNRCGHDPAHPQLDLARETSARMLAFITAAMATVEAFFHDRRNRPFPELLVLGGCRFKRSERCEAIVRVLKCLLYFMDMVTLRVGLARANDHCIGITEQRIAGWTGLSFSRVQRALADLRAAGFLFSRQPRETRADGSFIGLAAVRTLSKNLFRRLGLSIRLELEQKRAHKRRQEQRLLDLKRESSTRPADPLLRRLVGRLARAVAADPSPPAPRTSHRPRSDSWLQVVAKLCEDHKDDPAWSIERIRDEATRLLL
jgi:hypothetical protein